MSQLRDASRGGFNGVNYALSTELAVYRTATQTGLVPKIYTDALATSATGAVTFGLPASYFTTLNSIQATVVRNTADPALATFAMVRSYTATSVVVQCFESKNTGVLLGGNIEGLELTSAAVVVMLMVIGV